MKALKMSRGPYMQLTELAKRGWLIVVGPLALELAGHSLFGWLESDPVRNWVLFGLVLVLCAMVTAYWWRKKDLQALEDAFVSVPAENLSPDHLGFAREGCSPKPGEYPYSEEYIHRRFIPLGDDPALLEKVYTETGLLELMRSGKGVVLVGSEGQGKSRTLLELLRRARGYHVLCPRKEESIAVSKSALCWLGRRRMVLAIDELSRFANSWPALQDLMKQLGPRAVVVCTCRDGGELRAVQEAGDAGLRGFWQETPLKLSLAPLMGDEKAALATRLGGSRNLAWARRLSTPGAIVKQHAGVTDGPRYTRVEQVLDSLPRELLWIERRPTDGSAGVGDETLYSMVLIQVEGQDPFYIDRYPVTNGRYCRYQPETPMPADAGEDTPVTNLSLNMMQGYAKWSGKRLPAPEEWMAAARAPSEAGEALLPEIDWGLLQASGPTIGAERLAPVGKSAQTPSGLHDLFGNAEEIVRREKDETIWALGGDYTWTWRDLEAYVKDLRPRFVQEECVSFRRHGFRCVATQDQARSAAQQGWVSIRAN